MAKCSTQFVASVAALAATLGVGSATAADTPAASAAAPAAGQSVGHAQWQLIDGYCVKCHNTDDWAGSVAFDTMSPDNVPQDAKVWEAAIKKLKSGLMPPPGQKQPDGKAVTSMVSWLETTLDSAQKVPYTGHIPLQRLNRREYANAVHDLIGLDIDPAAYLPQDPVLDGFDTDASLLQVTPAFLDQSVDSARKLALDAVGDPTSVAIDTTYGNVSNMILSLAAAPRDGSGTQEKYQDGMPFGTRGGMLVTHTFPADGEYALTIGDMALARTVPNMEFENTLIALLDGKEFYRVNIGGEEDHKSIDQRLDDAVASINNRLRDIRFHATAGQHQVAVTFLRRSYAEDDGRTAQYQANDDRRPANLLEGGQHRVPAVHAIQIKGPIKITGMSDSVSRRKIFICRPATPAEEAPCARKIVTNLATHAFRRPVTDADVNPLLAFYNKARKNGGTFDVGVRDSLSAILASPLFLFRAEAASDTPRELTDLELASRLSFFIWSSLPDDELLQLAEKNQLSKPAVLKAQVHRMLADDRAMTLTTDFAFQWMNLAKLDTITPARALFAQASGVYDPRPLFKKELTLFVDSVLRSDQSVVDLLTANYTFMNEQIALLYGMEDVKGSGFHRVTLTDPKRFGLLGKGAVLMLTANPDRTAPVLRGAWIMERILGTPPATPPKGVPDLNKSGGARPTTVREKTEIHRRNPQCAACHAVMDPLGFALENFDTVGEFRTVDPQSHLPIDTAATMPDGTKLAGPEDLHRALAARGDQLVQTITEKLMTYAVGRPVDYRDMPTVRRIVRQAAADNNRFEAIVLGVVNSDAFRRREPAPPLPVSTTAQAANLTVPSAIAAP